MREGKKSETEDVQLLGPYKVWGRGEKLESLRQPETNIFFYI